MAGMSRAEYLRRKVSGQCTRENCDEDQSPTSLLCKSHEEDKKTYQARYRKKRKARLNNRRNRRKWRREAKQRGDCTVCGREPLVTKTMGEKCRRASLKRAAKLYIKKTGRIMHCSICGGPGHFSPTCTNRGTDALPSIAELATARLPVEVY